MDKASKLAYQQRLENYLESKQIYNLFENLLQSVVIAKPSDPLAFLIEKLSFPPTKKVFIVGPKGLFLKETALELCDFFEYTCVSMGDLLKKELSKKTAVSQEISQAFAANVFVDDAIVLQLLRNELDFLEKHRKNFVVEGFPRTRAQALALQSWGLVPDALFLVNVGEKQGNAAISRKLQKDERFANKSQRELKELVENCWKEHALNFKEMKEVCRPFFFEIDGEGPREEILEDIARLIKYKLRSNAPKTATKVIIVGGPAAGRTTLARSLSKKYGLILVSTYDLIKEIIRKKSKLSPILLELVTKGELIPDELIIPIVNSRLQQTDCQIQGFVLEGFPKTANQLQFLENMRFSANSFVVLESSEEIAYNRVSYRKIDPNTGEIYDFGPHSVETREISEEIRRNLRTMPLDTLESLRNRFARWNEFLKALESHFQGNPAFFKQSASLDPKQVLEKVSFHLENR